MSLLQVMRYQNRLTVARSREFASEEKQRNFFHSKKVDGYNRLGSSEEEETEDDMNRVGSDDEEEVADDI